MILVLFQIIGLVGLMSIDSGHGLRLRVGERLSNWTCTTAAVGGSLELVVDHGGGLGERFITDCAELERSATFEAEEGGFEVFPT